MKQVHKQKTKRPQAPRDLDTRTPSGKPLPY